MLAGVSVVSESIQRFGNSLLHFGAADDGAGMFAGCLGVSGSGLSADASSWRVRG